MRHDLSPEVVRVMFPESVRSLEAVRQRIQSSKWHLPRWQAVAKFLRAMLGTPREPTWWPEDAFNALHEIWESLVMTVDKWDAHTTTVTPDFARLVFDRLPKNLLQASAQASLSNSALVAEHVAAAQRSTVADEGAREEPATTATLPIPQRRQVAESDARPPRDGRKEKWRADRQAFLDEALASLTAGYDSRHPEPSSE